MGGNFSLHNDGALPDGVIPQVNNAMPQVTCGENTQLNEFTKQRVGAFDAESYCGTNTAASDGKCVANKTAICGTGTRYDDTKSQCMIDKYELGPGVRLDSQSVAQVDDNIFTQSVVWDPVNAAVTASSGAVSSFCNSEKNTVYDVSSDMCVADTANLLAQKCTTAKNLRYNADDDTCESTHATTNGNAFCGTNTALDVEGKCKASSTACDSKVMTFDATAAKCALAEDACSFGTTLKAGKCVADVSACATENMVFDDDKKTCVVNKCPGGTKLVNGQCEHDVSSTLLAEVKGDATTGFKCQAKIDSVCGEGTEFDHNTNTCQVKADVCPSGYSIEDDKCVPSLPKEIRARIRHGGLPSAFAKYCILRTDNNFHCGNEETEEEWRWEKLQDDRMDNQYLLFTSENKKNKQCRISLETQKFYCAEEDEKRTNDNFVFQVFKVRPEDSWNHVAGETIYMKNKYTNEWCNAYSSKCDKAEPRGHERFALDPVDRNASTFIAHAFQHAPTS